MRHLEQGLPRLYPLAFGDRAHFARPDLAHGDDARVRAAESLRGAIGNAPLPALGHHVFDDGEIGMIDYVEER